MRIWEPDQADVSFIIMYLHTSTTPLLVILTQPSEQQETATVGGQNGLGLEEAEAMDMER